MKLILLFAINIALVTVLFSCNDADTKTKDAGNKTTLSIDSANIPVENNNPADAAKDRSTTITAQFAEFSLGDISHYIFKDSTGKEWDFAANEDSLFHFELPLSKNNANETNQGWVSNRKLQGKWFVIKYIYRMLPQSPDGPMANVAVIKSAALKQ